jgi:hypothetical protein
MVNADSPNKGEPAGTGAWEDDAHPMGTAGFRATRTNAYCAGLFDQEKIMDSGVNAFAAILDGKHAARAFIEGGTVGLLIANYSNAGSEPFVSAHFKNERITLKPGDRMADKFSLLLLSQ